MPIRNIDKQFDDFATPGALTYARQNAGDRCIVELTFESSIKMSSQYNPMFYEYTVNEATSSSVSWLDEGFRVGAFVEVYRYNQFGGVLGFYTTFVTYVDDQIIQFSTDCFSGFALVENQEHMTFEVINYNRESVEFSFNLCKNALVGTQFSLIDGEVSRMVFDDIISIAVSSTINGTIVGNRSGSAMASPELQRLPDAGNARVYLLSFDFFQTGWFDEEWFESNNCLKAFIRGSWSTFQGEPFNQTISILDDEADTGHFNQAYNSQPNNSTLISGISNQIAYDQPTTIVAVVEGDLATLAVGAVYDPKDSLYYKNRLIPQQELCFLNYTLSTIIPSHPSFTQNIPTYGVAGYTIAIVSVVTAGTQHTVTMTFTPNTAFSNWFDDREEGDRLFYVWVKCGNINHLVYADQLTKAPPVGGPLEFEEKWEFIDHSQNVDTQAEIELIANTTYKFDTEDDLAFFGKFLLDKEQIVQKLSLSIEAYNAVTDEKFTLKKDVFSFDGVQISADGRYLLDESLSVNTGLPSTSRKINALLRLAPDLDTSTEYGVSIYYPIVLRWEYWLEQLNANVAFYPNQDKNWDRYDDIADWQVRLFVDLQKDNLSYIYGSQIAISPYDDVASVDTEIRLFRTIEGQEEVNFMPIGEVLLVEATFTSNTVDFSYTPRIWAQIRCYPTESAPPYINSTEVAFDGDASNPMNPLTGNLIQLAEPDGVTRIARCYIDTNKIDLTNGGTITAKIKDMAILRQERQKRDFNAIQLPQIYQEEHRVYAKSCTTQLVLAND